MKKIANKSSDLVDKAVEIRWLRGERNGRKEKI